MSDTTPIDPTVARVLDRQPADDSDDDDRLLAELEEDESALDAFREKRMQQLHDELSADHYHCIGAFHGSTALRRRNGLTGMRVCACV